MSTPNIMPEITLPLPPINPEPPFPPGQEPVPTVVPSPN